MLYICKGFDNMGIECYMYQMESVVMKNVVITIVAAPKHFVDEANFRIGQFFWQNKLDFGRKINSIPIDWKPGLFVWRRDNQRNDI